LVGSGLVLQVAEVARCAHRATEKFFGLVQLACIPRMDSLLGQCPGWLLE